MVISSRPKAVTDSTHRLQHAKLKRLLANGSAPTGRNHASFPHTKGTKPAPKTDDREFNQPWISQQEPVKGWTCLLRVSNALRGSLQPFFDEKALQLIQCLVTVHRAVREAAEV